MPKNKNKRTAVSPKDREEELVSLAYDVAEEQMRNGTATSQVITHFLKLGSLREQKELETMDMKNEFVAQKIELMKSQERNKEIAEEAMRAFRSYQPGGDEYET